MREFTSIFLSAALLVGWFHSWLQHWPSSMARLRTRKQSTISTRETSGSTTVSSYSFSLVLFSTWIWILMTEVCWTETPSLGATNQALITLWMSWESMMKMITSKNINYKTLHTYLCFREINSTINTMTYFGMNWTVREATNYEAQNHDCTDNNTDCMITRPLYIIAEECQEGQAPVDS